MFCKSNTRGYARPLKGIRLKTLAYGAKTLFTEFRLDSGSNLPRHSHPHEQTGYLISGRMRLAIGEETFAAEPGDSWCIPGDVEHGAQILEDCIAVEVFSPPRRDYLPENLARTSLRGQAARPVGTNSMDPEPAKPEPRSHRSKRR